MFFSKKKKKKPLERLNLESTQNASKKFKQMIAKAIAIAELLLFFSELLPNSGQLALLPAKEIRKVCDRRQSLALPIRGRDNRHTEDSLFPMATKNNAASSLILSLFLFLLLSFSLCSCSFFSCLILVYLFLCTNSNPTFHIMICLVFTNC